MDLQEALKKMPKEFVITLDDINQIHEIMEFQVPSGAARKIDAVLRKIRPYAPPTPPPPPSKPNTNKD